MQIYWSNHITCKDARNKDCCNKSYFRDHLEKDNCAILTRFYERFTQESLNLFLINANNFDYKMLHWGHIDLHLKLYLPIKVSMSICPSHSVPKTVSETENFIKESCKIYFKCDKNTFRNILQCWERQS